MKNTDDKSLKFVVNRYKERRLDKKKAFNRFCNLTGYRKVYAVPKFLKIAATIFIVATIVFAAGYRHFHSNPPIKPQKQQTDSLQKQKAGSDTVKTVVFHFNQTPVNAALKEIGCHYHTSLEASDSTKKVTGTIEVSSLDEAVDILDNTLNITIRKR